MKKILSDIQDGTFAKDWLMDNQTGCAHFLAMRKRAAEHECEKLVLNFVNFIAGMIPINLSTINSGDI